MNAPSTASGPGRPRLAEVTKLFLRVGNSTFGGGDPTMAALGREFNSRGWVTPDQFSIAYSLARVTPGTNVIAFCAATGWYILGVAGAIAAVLATTVPSGVLVIWLTRFCELANSSHSVRAAVSGAVAASVGTMAGAAVLLVRPQLSVRCWAAPLITVAGACLLARAGLSPVPILALAAIAGLVRSRL